jgi:hypothetical protein
MQRGAKAYLSFWPPIVLAPESRINNWPRPNEAPRSELQGIQAKADKLFIRTSLFLSCVNLFPLSLPELDSH